MAKIDKPGVLLPPAVGYSLQILFGLIFKNKISLRYYPRLIILVLINLINWPFRTYERAFINPRFKKRKIKENPIFIIGHWRSGTTHLHNILCEDPQMGYTSTYQVVFPDTTFNILGSFIFKNFTKLLIPGRRKGDSVVLDTSYPQEEEFALGDKTPLCFYYWWMIPKKIMEYYQKSIRFKGVDKKNLASWKEDYQLLIKKALAKSKKEVFISKNPPNTGRVKQILEIFPNARFIHIHRNPIDVILSTRHFYDKMLPHLQLQSINKEELNRNILKMHTMIMSDFNEQKKMLPKGQLIEFSFDDLECRPKELIEEIYSNLQIRGYENAKPYFDIYLEKNKYYKKNKHRINKSLLTDIQNECKATMEQYDYSIPKNMEVIDD